MNEKDIRDRIAQFLKRTARAVVVPASMGIGFTSTACNGNGLKQAHDAGLDAGVAQTDAPRTEPADAAIKDDVPLMVVPYVVVMALDAADLPLPPPPYLAPPPRDGGDTVWKLDTSPGDADGDAFADARDTIPNPPPPYVVWIPPDDQKK